MGKLFERVIAARLEAHILQRMPRWHEMQFGFRQGRSTVDAVKQVRFMAEDTVSREEVALAVSLDVTNAFNVIPWARIIEALRHFEVPAYLVGVIRTYLNDRWISYTGRNGEERRPVERGVPQGSVLGPILWITVYDAVLRCPMPPGTGMVCYTDDGVTDEIRAAMR
jgi:retron-type reverse transcriptase